MQHNHDHHSPNHTHTHSHGINAPFRALSFALCVILFYAAVEAFFGWHAKSLALLGDAGHMVSDALALGIAALASWIAKKPTSKTHSYGFGRAEVLAAWLSSLMLLFISLAIIVEAVRRIHAPVAVHGMTVMLVAFFGMIVNLLVAGLLAQSERTLNIRAALIFFFQAEDGIRDVMA